MAIGIGLLTGFLSAMRERGCRILRITGGEPLWIPERLLSLLNAAHAVQFSDIRLATNGLLLADWCSELKGSGLADIRVSLDTVDRATYQALTGSDACDQVIRSIDAAIAASLPVSINAVLTSLNEPTIDELVDFAIGRNLDLKLLDYVHHQDNPRAEGMSLYVDPTHVIRRLSHRFGKPCVHSLGRGIPMSVFATSSGTRVIVKDGSQGAHFGRICQACNEFPCREGLVTCTVSPGGLVMPCSMGRQDLRMRLGSLGSEHIAHQMLSAFAVLEFRPCRASGLASGTDQSLGERPQAQG